MEVVNSIEHRLQLTRSTINQVELLQLGHATGALNKTEQFPHPFSGTAIKSRLQLQSPWIRFLRCAKRTKEHRYKKTNWPAICSNSPSVFGLIRIARSPFSHKLMPTFRPKQRNESYQLPTAGVRTNIQTKLEKGDPWSVQKQLMNKCLYQKK